MRTIAFALAAAVAVVGGLRLLAVLAATDFRVVRVEGELTAWEQDQVRAAVGAGLDRPGARSVADVVDVVEDLGWVREVRVRRLWPDVLHVVVRRETPVARWGGNAWLSASGSVVSSDQLERVPGLAALPVINAARTDGTGAMEVFDRIGVGAAAHGMRVVALTENPAGEWSATFADGALVVLGRTALRERLERFAVVHRAHLRARQAGAGGDAPAGTVAHADARYPNGVAVRWVAKSRPADANGPESPAAAVALATTSAPPRTLAALGWEATDAE